jgi:hypothetical protein
MDSIPHTMTVLIPMIDVWLSATLGPQQYFQVRFHAAPSERDLRNAIKLLQASLDNVYGDDPPTAADGGKK